jgi:hypothetical protein
MGRKSHTPRSTQALWRLKLRHYIVTTRRSLPVKPLPLRPGWSSVEHVFDMGEGVGCDWPPPPVVAPPEEVIDCLVEDPPGSVEPVRWS